MVLHGLTATGKSSVTEYVLEMMDEGYSCRNTEDLPSNYAIIKSQECVTARHLLERTVGEVARAIKWTGKIERCEDVERLVVILEKILQCIQPLASDVKQREEGLSSSGKFTLVFDGIDKQRDASHTLVPSLGRLSEVVRYGPSKYAPAKLHKLSYKGYKLIENLYRFPTLPQYSSSPPLAHTSSTPQT